MNAEQLKKYDEKGEEVNESVAEFDSGEELTEALKGFLRPGDRIRYHGVLHRVIDAGKQGLRVAATHPQPGEKALAEAEAAELHALFALQQTRMTEAVEAWRKATGKYGFLPDLGDLLAWLMDRPAALEAQVRELREAVQTALDWRGLDGDGITDPVALQLACLLTAT